MVPPGQAAFVVAAPLETSRCLLRLCDTNSSARHCHLPNAASTASFSSSNTSRASLGSQQLGAFVHAASLTAVVTNYSMHLH